MVEEQKLLQVNNKELVGVVAEFFAEHYRLVQICCTNLGDVFELNYSFDKNYSFVNLKLSVQAAEEVPSISAIYWSAFIYENEVHDLFGIKIKNINIDYGGKFFRTSKPAPFAVIEKSETPEKK